MQLGEMKVLKNKLKTRLRVSEEKIAKFGHLAIKKIKRAEILELH